MSLTARYLALLCADLLIIGGSMTNAAHAEEPFSLAATPGKLPKNIVPRAYIIHVSPDPGTRACEGSETIDLEVLQPASSIVLNAAGLDVTKATIRGAEPDAALTPLQPQPDPAEQTVTLMLPRTLPAGKYQLALAFHYQLYDLPQGLYLEHYDAPSGKKTMLATQMEPTDARRMFPCWDEPVFRATYQLNVTVPPPARSSRPSPTCRSSRCTRPWTAPCKPASSSSRRPRRWPAISSRSSRASWRKSKGKQTECKSGF